MERDRVYLLDVLDAARLALSYTEDIAEETFYKDTHGTRFVMSFRV